MAPAQIEKEKEVNPETLPLVQGEVKHPKREVLPRNAKVKP